MIYKREFGSKEWAYSSKTGKLFYKVPDGWYEVGQFSTKNKYASIRVAGIHHLLHRLIWYIVHDYWPNTVDHKDRNTKNNRLSNLRDTDHSVNARNSRKRKRKENELPVGINRTRNGRYIAHYGCNYKVITGLVRNTVEEALIDRKDLEQFYG